MLAPGTQLGHYEIVEPLGAGGMGTVYRARDPRLRREIALKVLPPTADQDMKERFISEARIASSLSHPNIVIIHDVGEAVGTAFIAMELVKGATLRTVVGKPLPLERLLRIAVQIVAALRAAHDGGIAHRDLKPENVLLSSDDAIKVVDFGLAKAGRGEEETIGSTRVGVILGTPGYLSPEQARGSSVDWRSDLFSLGVVLYELATGARAFERPSAIETMMATVADEPLSPGHLRSDLPPPLVWAIQRCLAKDPAQRYAATADLHRDLLAIQQHLASPRAATLPPSNIADSQEPLVGRDDDVRRLTQRITASNHQWITITGPGGVGKTSLAQQVAREVADVFGDRRYFVPLAQLTDVMQVIPTIARIFGAQPHGNEKVPDALARVLAEVRDPLLLVLDNFEHLPSAAPLVAALFTQAPAMTVLATSRALLRVSVEHEFSLDVLDSAAAVRLFHARAAVAAPRYQATAAESADVAALCERLGRLPLAIELAAARVKLLPPTALLARLEGRLLSLSGGARDLPERQQTLRGAIDWSFSLLDEAEQRLFRRLGVFAGGWTLDAAEAVCDAPGDLGLDILSGIGSLVEKSLITPTTTTETATPRFTMLDMLREYALERLEAAEETAAIRLAHAAYCLVLTEEGGAAADAASQSRWLAQCDHEMANIRVAATHLVEVGRIEWALRLITSLFQYWQSHGSLIEGETRLRALLAHPQSANHPALRARALFELTAIVHARGDYDASIRLAATGISAFTALGDSRGAAAAHNGLAIAHRDHGEYAEAERHFAEAIRLWRESGEQSAVARALSNRASLALRAGHSSDARRLYAECRELFAAMADEAGVAWTLQHEGDAAREAGEAGEAERLYREAQRRFAQQQDEWGLSSSVTALGELALDRGDVAQSLTHFAAALRSMQTLGSPRGIARLLDAFGRTAAASGDGDRALRLAGAAAAQRRRVGAHLPENERRALDGALGEARGRGDAALAWLAGESMTVDQAIAYALSVT